MVLYCPQNVNIIPSHLHFVKQIVPIFNMTAVLYAHVKYSTFWYQNEYHTQFQAQQPISLLPAVILLCYIDISRFQHLAHQAFETIIIITSCQQNTTVNGKQSKPKSLKQSFWNLSEVELNFKVKTKRSKVRRKSFEAMTISEGADFKVLTNRLGFKFSPQKISFVWIKLDVNLLVNCPSTWSLYFSFKNRDGYSNVLSISLS